MRRVASALELTSPKIAGLARYWEEKRAGRTMPTWAEIDPAEIKPLLPHLMVTRYEPAPFRVGYVLVGTWVVQYSGAEFTGRYLDELDFPSEIDTDWAALHRLLFVQGLPIFGVCRFISESGFEQDYEVAMLPIASPDGTMAERGLCVEDFPLGVPVIPNENAIALKPTSALTPGAQPATVGGSAVRLEPVSADDGDFRRCLEEAKLATVDLGRTGTFYFRLTDAGRGRGYGGFEAHGAHPLLRSIVVEGRERGHGYGRTLVNGLIAEARKLGLKDAYLLTETAAPFFAALDFTPCAREAAPPEIAASQQFAALCPASAKLMRREF